MLAAAASLTDMTEVIRAGLAQIPAKSRLYERLSGIVDDFENGTDEKTAFDKIAADFDDSADWCGTISNASIVTASLLYGRGDFGKSICLAVQTGFDTDCNGATAGSIIGAVLGSNGIDAKWSDPLNDTLQTTISGYGMVKISEVANETCELIEKFKTI
jgi:ADP-ribosylglycohydrolase